MSYLIIIKEMLDHHYGYLFEDDLLRKILKKGFK